MSEFYKDPVEAARELGLVMVPSTPEYLQIDIDERDSQAARKNFETRLSMARSDLGPEFFMTRSDLLGSVMRKPFYTVSKSGNLHVYVQLAAPLELYGRLILQQRLGSDPVREYLSFVGAIRGISPACCLFEKPEEFERLKPWLAVV